jgi:predicted Ser/Thr protein kinase
MDFNKLFNIPFPTLKQLAQEMDIHPTRSKEELINKMTECFKEYEDYKTQTENKYKIIKQLGEKGKEGTTYLVSTPDDQEYAMKTFRRHKSPITLKQEAKLQKIAGEAGISPRVIDKDLVSKTIVMTKMDYHLIDVMKKQKGNSETNTTKTNHQKYSKN